MNGQALTWPPLPTVDELLVDEPEWAHPGIGAGGAAHLRVWSTTACRGRRLAVVTDPDTGCSVTNAAEHIHAALRAQFGPYVVHLEHYPPRRDDEPHTLDQVVVGHRGVRRALPDHTPRWRRIWPVPLHNPRYAEFLAWTSKGGAAVLAELAGGAR